MRDRPTLALGCGHFPVGSFQVAPIAGARPDAMRDRTIVAAKVLLPSAKLRPHGLAARGSCRKRGPIGGRRPAEAPGR